MWIAKDKDDSVFLYMAKPYKNEKNGVWTINDYSTVISMHHFSDIELPNMQDILDNLSWEGEPVEVFFQIDRLYSTEDINELAEDYEKSISDPECPFYTPEDIKKAFIEAFKLARKNAKDKKDI